MKLHSKFILSAVLVGLAFNACSTKKDAFLNRSFHAMNTKYNVLYNGDIALDEGTEELNNNYRDNYWDILPVERLEVTDDIRLDSEGNNPKFTIAEEKATKAIQKHSMDIKYRERNPEIDGAFLLLGKSRYYDQRYIPALEAFNYILKNNTDSDMLIEATIWREKVNIRLENEELAIKNLNRLLKNAYLKDQEYADARAMMAQAYINLKAPDTALQQLRIAAVYTKKKPERGRYYFIVGQLYNELGYKDSANYAFDKVIELKRKSPRVYMINAKLQKFRNTEVTDENRQVLQDYLTEMEENRENRPFLDKIYRQIAEFYMANNADTLALTYYNKSLLATQDEPRINALNYEDLAEYYFDEHDYKVAGNYYDSTLTNLADNPQKYRYIKRKLDNLEDVIKYEDIVQYSDSVIHLYQMSPEKRMAYFEDYVSKLKAQDEADSEKETKRNTAGIAAFAESSGGKQNKGKFYFYNITSLGYGKADFRTRWGDRPLEDDWRWANKNQAQMITSVSPGNAVADTIKNKGVNGDKYSVDYYLGQIPTKVSVIDSLKTERNFANYQLGLIYKEKFKENTLAAGKLEDVLNSDPEERLILPSKYNLYKIYKESGSPLASQMKDNIIADHPDSRYAEILLNPQAILADDSDSMDAQYDKLYKVYQDQKYLEVIAGAQEFIDKHTGDPLVPKFEMLKANSIGRIQGFEAYKEALNYVALNYPNMPEGKKAQHMVSGQLPKMENKEFTQETGSKGASNWKVVFPFRIRDDDQALKLIEVLKKSIKDLNYSNIISKDIYNLETEFVVVHGFKSKDFALGYAELLKNNKDYKVRNENFVILSANYQIIQIHKNLEDYKRQFGSL